MNGKTLLAAACAISLACGYIAGKAGSPSGRENEAVPSAQTRPDRTRARENRPRGTGDSTLLDSILNSRPIGEIPHAELASLIARLSKYEPDMAPLARSKQSYQLQLLLAKLSPADLDRLATSTHADADPDKNLGLDSILSALAAKDPERAIAWLSGREVSARMHSLVIGVIARDDPMTAADFLRKAFLDKSISQSSHYSAALGIGQAIAKLGVDPLLAYIDSLPSNQQSNIARNAMSTVPEGERLRLLEELRLRMEDGRLPAMNLNQLFYSVLANDEKGAREWFSKLPDDERTDSLRASAATALFARGEKEAAAEWMREALAATPGHEKRTLQGIIRSISGSNPDAIPFFARLLPEGMEFTAKDFEDYATSSLNNGTGGLTTIAAAIRDPGEQARLIAGTLDRISSGHSRKLNANDLDILSRQIVAMGLTGENATLVNKAIDAARNPKPSAER